MNRKSVEEFACLWIFICNNNMGYLFQFISQMVDLPFNIYLTLKALLPENFVLSFNFVWIHNIIGYESEDMIVIYFSTSLISTSLEKLWIMISSFCWYRFLIFSINLCSSLVSWSTTIKTMLLELNIKRCNKCSVSNLSWSLSW